MCKWTQADKRKDCKGACRCRKIRRDKQLGWSSVGARACPLAPSLRYNPFAMRLDELDGILRSTLKISDFNDISLNGVQVACCPEREITKVALAVDACQASIDAAIEEGAQLLFVHHGLFWGQPIAVSGIHYKRVKTLLDADVGLYACHLPLDAHPVLGNNAQMCLSLGMKGYDPFGLYHGQYIGFKGELPFEMDCQEIARLLGFSVEWGLRILPFGKEMVRTVGIISGGAADDVHQAMDEGLDCYITGECSHELYHTLLERGMNMVCGGHYQSEVFGVKAVGRFLEKEYGLETVFIDRKTAL